MSNPWFRLYAEFASDHKMQMMSEAYQRRYVMLLCLRCSNGDVTLQDEEVAFQLRISSDEWSETKAVFIGKNLIDKHNRVLAWERRQFISDSSVERVRKHREKAKRQSNVTVTAPDTDTEQIQNRTDKKTSVQKSPCVVDENFERFWSTYNHRVGRHKAVQAWAKINPDENLAEVIISAAEVYAKATSSTGYQKHPTTWLNGKHWEDDPEAVKPKIARMQQPLKTQHQINKLGTTKALFGDASSFVQSTKVIEGEVIYEQENSARLLG